MLQAAQLSVGVRVRARRVRVVDGSRRHHVDLTTERGNSGVRLTRDKCYTFSMNYRPVHVHDGLLAHVAREVVAVLPQLLQQLRERYDSEKLRQ